MAFICSENVFLKLGSRKVNIILVVCFSMSCILVFCQELLYSECVE